jgi:DNA-binding transcriptional ArsR family regulator
METMQAIEALSSLAQETRLAVFRLLIKEAPDGLPAGAVAERLGVPNATLSFHLSQLTRSGLIQSRRDGRTIWYSPNLENVRELLSFLLEDCCGGRGDICKPFLAVCDAESEKKMAGCDRDE